jgi:hypothetical protein
MKITSYLLVAILAGRSMGAAEPTRKIVVSLTDRKLALVKDGQVTAIYPVAIGRPSSPTPEGVFQVVTRIPDPTWWGPEGKVVAPGPANPLGNRWIGLSQKGYGIHGTNAPRSVGKAASHGCIRMRKADVESLFQAVAVGDPVEFRALALSAVLELPEDKLMVIAQSTDKALTRRRAATLKTGVRASVQPVAATVAKATHKGSPAGEAPQVAGDAANIGGHKVAADQSVQVPSRAVVPEAGLPQPSAALVPSTQTRGDF